MFLIFALLRVTAMNGEFIYSLPSASTSSRDDPLPVYRHNSQPTPSQIQPYGLEFSGSTTVMESTSQTTAKSAVTPLRKHHKLLKDGSGHEVWPESVEQIFVDGLRAYTASTVSQSHAVRISDAAVPGRSRLRNAYLVKYLAQYGIERTRKQVASHLQVLKNMWKADGNYSDYCLVVGPDSLSLPQTQPSNFEGAINRRPSLSFSSTSTSTTSSRPSFGMTSPELWSEAMSSPHSTPSSSAHSSPSGVQHSFELSRSALSTRSIRSHKYRTATGDAVEGISIPTAPGQMPAVEQALNHRHETLHRRQQPKQQLHDHDLSGTSTSFERSFTSFERAPAVNVVPGFESQRLSRNQVYNIPISPPHQALASSIVTSDTHLATPTPAKLHLFTEGMLPLSVNLQMVPGDGVAYLRLQLNVPKYQATSESSFSRNFKSGFGAQLETICPAGTRSLSSVFTCVTQVWGTTSFGTNHPSQPKGVYSTLKQEPMSYDSSMLWRKVSAITRPSHTVPLPRHRTGDQLSCLGRQEAMVEIIGVLPEQAIPSTSNKQLMILNFPESALSSCQLLEPGATMIHQDISFAGQTILCVTYTLNRQEQLPAAKLLGWERLPIPTGPAAVPSTSLDFFQPYAIVKQIPHIAA
ncbi:hypothetical protein GGU10DRAFT_351325 [Lentinula aff. detonsa]|uniref:TEA domain-containing protein n=1 Tax=Lentinula aff. detonsa TaxID=2804958 RepID=A0AA38KWV5_9AGAR|nr:hypothetical protein GGU10DRAFT_351325 [Lentinula aff. detonsa]